MAGDPSDASDASSEWLTIAISDLRLGMLHVADEGFVRHVCFLSQHAVEKFLKAFLVWSGIKPPKTHDLDVLVTWCQRQRNDFASWVHLAEELSDYAVSVRYPDGVAVTLEHAADATNLAKDVRSFVLLRMTCSDESEI